MWLFSNPLFQQDGYRSLECILIIKIIFKNCPIHKIVNRYISYAFDDCICLMITAIQVICLYTAIFIIVQYFKTIILKYLENRHEIIERIHHMKFAVYCQTEW